MKKKIIVQITFTAYLVLLFACRKSDPGAQGPAGAAGPAGPQGPAGSANVIYSPWIASTAAAWTPSNPGTGITNYNFSINAPGITNTILNNGVVLVFFRTRHYGTTILPDNTITSLPFTFDYTVGGVVSTDIWTPFISTGSIRINFTNSLNFTFPYSVVAPVAAPEFRYVIIPGGVAGGRYSGPGGAAACARLPYEDLCASFNIPSEGGNDR